ncbi:hypothetical protein ACO0LB_17145 [Undibacterium sp. SXout7W]|uniref:hypothetical protein n=1 Tax=Undibacterium sp. SXout7W TaxID=3413049 RepID=UPI003BF35E8E
MSIKKDRGITQVERFPAALAPRSAVLDERPFTVLLAMAPHYAKMLNFYDTTGNLAGDWQAFFDSDHTFVLAEICAWTPLQDLDLAMLAQSPAQLSTHTVSEQQHILNHSDWQLLQEIFNIVVMIDRWQHRVSTQKLAALKPIPVPFLEMMQKIISRDLKAELHLITRHPAHWKAWNNLLGSTNPITRLALMWGLSAPTDPIQEIGEISGIGIRSHGRNADRVVPDLSRIKLILLEACRDLKALAKEYLLLELKQHDHLPQGAMYMAFLKLFRLVQLDMNTFSERHLEYYYKTVLRLQPMDGEPDVAVVVVQLASTSSQYQLEQGVQMTAGSDPLGNKILFSNIKPVSISQTNIQSLCALYMGETDDTSTGQPIDYIYAAPVADSRNGLGAPLEEPDRGWSTFGPANASTPADNTALNAELGLLIASSVLLLQEGTRKVTLSLSFTDTDLAQTQTNTYIAAYAAAYPRLSAALPDSAASILSNAFLLSVSTKAGWVPVPDFCLDTFSDDSTPFCWHLTFTLANDAPALIPNASLYPAIASDRPMLKLLLNPRALVYPYSYFQSLTLSNVVVNVSVSGLQTMTIETLAGPIATGKPFGPFGAVPVTGASFEVVAEELLLKKTENVTLTLEWLSLPATGFKKYYADYAPYPFDNQIFTVNLYVAANGSWIPQSNNVPRTSSTITRTDSQSGYTLFAENGAGLASETAFIFDTFVSRSTSTQASGNMQDSAASLASNSATQALHGTLSVELVTPPYAFGNSLYSTLFAEWAVKSVVFIEALLTKPATPSTVTSTSTSTSAQQTANIAAQEEGSAPNPPFSPTINSISLDYSASETIPLIALNEASDTLVVPAACQFYQLYPFGYALPQQIPPTLFPLMPARGQLLIGLANLNPPQSLNLYFEFREKNATQFSLLSANAAAAQASQTNPAAGDNTNTSSVTAPIEWRYLSNNQWKEFPSNSLISNTNNFTNSGMVEIQIPADMNAGNSMMETISSQDETDIFWLTAYTSGDADPAQYNTTVAIWPQAVEVSRVNPTTTEILPLPANTIIALSQPVAEVKSLYQPYPSKGGRARENLFRFQARVAERLKHKQRAIQPSDFELLVLEAFPAVWQVKCITVNNSKMYANGTKSLVLPGDIVLALSPPIQAVPQLSRPIPVETLELVARHVQALASPFIRKITVRNLSYDTLTVCVNVIFKNDKKTSVYQSELNQFICDYLSPWKKELQAHLNIGAGSVLVADLARLIREQVYVQQIGPLVITQAWHTEDGYGINTIDESGTVLSTSPWSVLVPVAQHRILALTDAQLEPDVGVGSLVIGGDFILAANTGNHTQPEQAHAHGVQQKTYTLLIPKHGKTHHD